VFELTQKFPREEMYSLTDQIRRSSRSVAANITEAWRKRRYEGAFVSKLSDADTEAAETQTWLQFAFRCGYLKQTDLQAMEEEYEIILRMLVAMMANAGKWTLSRE
jgi:four helix bundle protein